MESIIKWQTGEPKEEGYYLVTFQSLDGLTVETAGYDDYGWGIYTSDYCKVIAWCPLSEIEPYKELKV